MHIKRIHEMIECLSKDLESKFKGDLENMSEQDKCDMDSAADWLKDLCQAEYYATVVKAMNEEKEEQKKWDEEECKFYRGQRRDSRGRYMFTEPPYMRNLVEERIMRDMDMVRGRMNYPMTHEMYMPEMNERYYQQSRNNDANESGNSAMSRNRSSRYGYTYDNYMNNRRGYNMLDPNEKNKRTKETEHYAKEIVTMMSDIIDDATPEEKNILRSTFTKLLNSMG